MTLKKDQNFEEMQTFCLKNEMKNLINFNTTSRKSECLHFDGLLKEKLCNFWVLKNELAFKK